MDVKSGENTLPTLKYFLNAEAQRKNNVFRNSQETMIVLNLSLSLYKLDEIKIQQSLSNIYLDKKSSNFFEELSNRAMFEIKILFH